jgi:serine/threonine protein phosphatase 1
MAGRTFAIGDIHGDFAALAALLARLPHLDADDTLVFLGDYVDRGPASKLVVETVRSLLAKRMLARIVALRGNHEDAWLRAHREGFPQFVSPLGNGTLACYRSYVGGAMPEAGEAPSREESRAMVHATFFPPDHIDWFDSLPHWYEDDHAIYVHAGVPRRKGRFLHPSEVEPKTALLWLRDEDFFRNYRGKRIIVGHTVTECLPPELSQYTPSDPTDLWAGECVIAIDTAAGKGGFLTAVELPSLRVYESRSLTASEIGW